MQPSVNIQQHNIPQRNTAGEGEKSKGHIISKGWISTPTKIWILKILSIFTVSSRLYIQVLVGLGAWLWKTTCTWQIILVLNYWHIFLFKVFVIFPIWLWFHNRKFTLQQTAHIHLLFHILLPRSQRRCWLKFSDRYIRQLFLYHFQQQLKEYIVCLHLWTVWSLTSVRSSYGQHHFSTWQTNPHLEAGRSYVWGWEMGSASRLLPQFSSDLGWTASSSVHISSASLRIIRISLPVFCLSLF